MIIRETGCITGNRINYFGKIMCRDAIYRVLLNEYGKIVKPYWNQIPKQFSFARLDEYIIMPNHIHGIIVINESMRESLSKIIRWFKGRVTYEIRKSGGVFLWQGRFYEHIIRNKESLNRIRKYIRNNPKNWEFDTENIDINYKSADPWFVLSKSFKPFLLTMFRPELT